MTPEQLAFIQADERAMEDALRLEAYGASSDMRSHMLRQRLAFRDGWKAASAVYNVQAAAPAHDAHVAPAREATKNG